MISTITGGLLVGLVLEAQPLGRTTLRTKMLFTNALASGDAGGHISPMYLASAISVMSWSVMVVLEGGEPKVVENA